MDDDRREEMRNGFEDAARGFQPRANTRPYQDGYAIAQAVKDTAHLFKPPPPAWEMRTPDEIISGDALTWANMSIEQLRQEHEILRRALEDARGQISRLVPIVAWRHRCPRCQEQRLQCPGCGDPFGTQGVLP